MTVPACLFGPPPQIPPQFAPPQATNHGNQTADVLAATVEGVANTPLQTELQTFIIAAQALLIRGDISQDDAANQSERLWMILRERAHASEEIHLYHLTHSILHQVQDPHIRLSEEAREALSLLRRIHQAV